MKNLKHLVSLVFVIALVVSTNPVWGQLGLGGGLQLSVPQDKFGDVSDLGGGFNGKCFYQLSSVYFLGFRADFDYILYSVKHYEDEILDLPVDVETRYQALRFTIGPHFQTPTGFARFYFSPMIGIYNYHTAIEVEDEEIDDVKDAETKWGWNISGGVLFSLTTPENGPSLFLDIGIKQHTVKNIVTRPDKTKSDARDVTIHAGVVALL